MEQGRRHSILAPFAAFVTLFPQDQLPLMTGEAFPLPGSMRSRGELRVLLALAQGLGAKEAADMLGVGVSPDRPADQSVWKWTHIGEPNRAIEGFRTPGSTLSTGQRYLL